MLHLPLLTTAPGQTQRPGLSWAGLLRLLCLSIGFSGCCTVLFAQPLSFGLFGDTPYSAWERARLPALMAQMQAADVAFAVHVGDFKSGAEPCSDALFAERLALFQSAPLPLVYLPGDNDWTDCHRASNGRFDPLERLTRLRQTFLAGEQTLGLSTLPLLRQSADPAFAPYRENVRWEAGGALFVGLHVTGSDNNFHGVPGHTAPVPVPEFLARSAANRVWLAQAFEHARSRGLAGVLIAMQGNPGFEAWRAGRASPGYQDFLAQLVQETRRFGRPVVLVHGDTHRQRIDQPLHDPASAQPLSNFTRVETFGWPFFGWVRGRVDASDPRVFRFFPQPWVTVTDSR
jgi:hypothetical protein